MPHAKGMSSSHAQRQEGQKQVLSKKTNVLFEPEPMHWHAVAQHPVVALGKLAPGQQKVNKLPSALIKITTYLLNI